MNYGDRGQKSGYLQHLLCVSGWVGVGWGRASGTNWDKGNFGMMETFFSLSWLMYI